MRYEKHRVGYIPTAPAVERTIVAPRNVPDPVKSPHIIDFFITFLGTSRGKGEHFIG